jgi:hypothetical protein
VTEKSFLFSTGVKHHPFMIREDDGTSILSVSLLSLEDSYAAKQMCFLLFIISLGMSNDVIVVYPSLEHRGLCISTGE